MIRQIEQLFEKQIAEWPLLAAGIAALRQVQSRIVRMDPYQVEIRHLPHRITSTTAAVDRASIASRPCFLCAANLPAEEKGLPFSDDYTIYCNPFPILERHLTIVHREHRPQRIAGQVGRMLELASALPGYFIIYNGPECGASAPDHMHFQACSSAGVPTIGEVAKTAGNTLPDYGRRVWILRAASTPRLNAMIERLNEVIARQPEPLMNLAAFADGGSLTALLFPRSKHRPQVFHTGELTVSPATIDLCGVFVAPKENDFSRISANDVRSIYEEVTISESLFEQLISL